MHVIREKIYCAACPAAVDGAVAAGAYTRPLFSST